MEDSEQLQQKVEYANFSSRTNASLIDTFLITVLLLPLMTVIEKIYGEEVPSIAFKKNLPNVQGSEEALKQEEVQEILYQMLEAGLFTNYILEMLGYFFFMGIIIIVFWRLKGATPGKKWLNMRIVDAKTLQPPSTFQYIVRMFAYILSVLPLTLGFFWALIDKKNRCLHDLIAGTAVIKIRSISTEIDSLADELS